jgi:hypothetical protein
MRATSSALCCDSPFVCIHRTKTRRSGAVTIFSKRLFHYFVLEHRLANAHLSAGIPDGLSCLRLLQGEQDLMLGKLVFFIASCPRLARTPE